MFRQNLESINKSSVTWPRLWLAVSKTKGKYPQQFDGCQREGRPTNWCHQKRSIPVKRGTIFIFNFFLYIYMMNIFFPMRWRHKAQREIYITQVMDEIVVSLRKLENYHSCVTSRPATEWKEEISGWKTALEDFFWGVGERLEPVGHEVALRVLK